MDGLPPSRSRRPLAAAFGAALALVLAIAAASAEPRTLHIGTGGQDGVYFPIGSLIAQSLTEGAGCTGAGTCEREGLLAVAQVSNGSVANVEDLEAGRLDAALIQADVAHWAWTGSGPFEGTEPRRRLRAVANLYREKVHVVVRRDSGLTAIPDLRGRRVALGQPGSGTLVGARMVLAAYGMSESDVAAVYEGTDMAPTSLREGLVDAYFLVSGSPTPSVLALASEGLATLLPIDGAAAETLVATSPFFIECVILADDYPGIGATPTVSVGAQLFVRADLDPDLVQFIAETIWSERTLSRLQAGHAKGRFIMRERALEGIAIPLHPGAERYYRAAAEAK